MKPHPFGGKHLLFARGRAMLVWGVPLSSRIATRSYGLALCPRSRCWAVTLGLQLDVRP